MTKEQAKDFRNHESAMRLADAISKHAYMLTASNRLTMDDEASGFNKLVVELRGLIADLRGPDDPKPECPAKRMEYIVYYSDGAPDAFAVAVDRMLSKGWVCQGGVTVSAAGVFYQALVREVAG